MKTKNIILLLIICFTGDLLAQKGIYPDTLMRDSRLHYVFINQFCYSCESPEKEKLVFKCFFDRNGLNYKREIYDGVMHRIGMIYYEFENSKLKSIKEYRAHVLKSDHFGWDSTLLSKSVKYNYHNNLLNEVILNDTVESISSKIIYFYDKKLRIYKEVQNVHQETELIYLELLDSDTLAREVPEKIIKNFVKKKIYKYIENKCQVDYFLNEKLTGKEYITYNKTNDIINRFIINLEGDTLLKENFVYSKDSKLIEKNVDELIEDSFYGDSNYISGINKIAYEYNKYGQIMKENMYHNGKLIVAYGYTYIER